MSNYKNALSKIKMNKEMEERIMKEVNRNGNETKEVKRNSRAWYIPTGIATCAVLLLGIFVVPNLVKDEDANQVQIPNPIIEIEGVKELKESVSFALKVPTVMLQGYEVSDTSAIAETLAQINYSNGSNVITYRMAEGTEDISGDYNTYDTLREITINDQSIVMKGNANGYQVAVWNDGTCSYAVSSEVPLTEAEFIIIIESIE